MRKIALTIVVPYIAGLFIGWYALTPRDCMTDAECAATPPCVLTWGLRRRTRPGAPTVAVAAVTWDLREQTLLAKWTSEGHEFRRLSPNNINGAAVCLRCATIVHVSARAAAAAGNGGWNAPNDPTVVMKCKT